jgi:rubredoxin
MASRFDGAVHDEANADIGSNRDGERVVRLDLTYSRGTAPSGTTMILTLDAAIALRNHLDGLFAAAGVDDSGGLVDEDDACPNCGERRQDMLVWIENSAVENEVQCEACGMVYRLSHTAQQ